MSHVDSSDDETGTILEPENPDDSKESVPKDVQEQPEVKDKAKKNDEFNEYDISDDKELDDKEW